MYNVEVNKAKKLIKVSLSGFVKLDEMTAFGNEFKKALNQFGPNEVYLLSDMSEFKPATPDVAPVMKEIVSAGVTHSKKVATIHKSVLANLQMKRIGDEAHATDVIKRFATEEEAMKYLYE